MPVKDDKPLLKFMIYRNLLWLKACSMVIKTE